VYTKVNSLAVGMNWTNVFLVVLLFQIIVSAISYEGVFFLFAGISGLGAVYLYFDMPESKGKERFEMIKILVGED